MTELPPDLADALAARGAAIVIVQPDPPRTRIWANGPEGPLFAWFSTNPADESVLDHEIAVREEIGVQGPLRGPPVLERGRTWRLEPAMTSKAIRGPQAIATVEAAAAALAERDLPKAPRFGRAREAPVALVRRRARLLGSPLPLGDMMRARRTMARTRLPLVTSHGDFQRTHLFLFDDGAWVIDWERVGRRPAGFDLLYLWADLEDEQDRELVFEAAMRLVGPKRRAELVGLRHVLLVRTIVAKLTDPNPVFRDLEGAERLIAMLPAVRAEAKAA